MGKPKVFPDRAVQHEHSVPVLMPANPVDAVRDGNGRKFVATYETAVHFLMRSLCVTAPLGNSGDPFRISPSPLHRPGTYTRSIGSTLRMSHTLREDFFHP
jgi:hypothetical protein